MRHVDLTRLDAPPRPDRPAGFRVGAARLSELLGSQRTGATLYELPPGEAVCPYHYELGEEEWALVVSGRATVRTPDGSTELGPMSLVFFPRGADGAHQLRNDGDEVVRVLLWSDVVFPTATVYPDSDKVGVYTADGADDLIVPRSSAVDYYHGEGGASG
jgi:uncharacterized cupin superfamily protein